MVGPPAENGFHFVLCGVGQRGGVPDDLFLIGGKFLAIEWKRPGYKSKKISQQDLEIQRIEAAGGVAGKVSCIEELEQLLERIKP